MVAIQSPGRLRGVGAGKGASSHLPWHTAILGSRVILWEMAGVLGVPMRPKSLLPGVVPVGGPCHAAWPVLLAQLLRGWACVQPGWLLAVGTGPGGCPLAM